MNQFLWLCVADGFILVLGGFLHETQSEREILYYSECWKWRRIQCVMTGSLLTKHFDLRQRAAEQCWLFLVLSPSRPCSLSACFSSFSFSLRRSSSSLYTPVALSSKTPLPLHLNVITLIDQKCLLLLIWCILDPSKSRPRTPDLSSYQQKENTILRLKTEWTQTHGTNDHRRQRKQ